MTCERCHAGEMVAYEKKVGAGAPVTIIGRRCDRCGYTELDNDEDVWSAVGL